MDKAIHGPKPLVSDGGRLMAKTVQELHEEFEVRGFLGKGIAAGVADLRAENGDWFQLAETLNTCLVEMAVAATAAVKTNSWDAKAVAVRVLLRSCGNLEGVILMCERGMVAQGRILTRNLMEDAFAMAALHDNPDKYLALLKEDSEGSRRLQGNFIVLQGLVEKGETLDKLQAAIDALGKLRPMSPKAIAELGPLNKQYLAYQRLSDDAAHTSARSLDKHVEADAQRTGWHYKWGAGDAGEIAATLHHAVLAGIPIGVALTQMLDDKANNEKFGDVSERFLKMPAVEII